MASQLKRNNETVLMLLMVDTYAWFPNSLLYAKDFFYNQAEVNLKNATEIVVNIMLYFERHCAVSMYIVFERL